MTTVPASPATLPQEEWLDADFELNDDEPLHSLIADSDKEDDEDWDMEMDIRKTGGAKARAVVAGIAARSELSKKALSEMISIRPPLPSTLDEDDEDDEGISTIKMATLRPKAEPKPAPPTIDEDFESAFALPSDLTQLSLRPLSHQSSKNSLEWGEQASSSSQSSDAYSNLGLDHASASSNSTSASQPETETDDDEDEEGDLEGLVIPSGLFESSSSAKHLAKVLEMKKMPVVDEAVKVATPDPEDDYEIGLIIGDDADFSPSRLLVNVQQPPPRRPSTIGNRSSSAPARPLSLKPSARHRADRAKSPINPPPSSARQLQRIKMSPSPPPRVQRTQSYQQALLSAPPSANNSFLAAKAGSLRGQKSHTGLKPVSPPTSQRKLIRKASLSSLMETSQGQVSDVPDAGLPSQFMRYDAPTAASRAKSHTSSTSRIRGLEYNVPPTRPSTPSSNPAALRLTMPTSSSRLKSRPPISSVFPSSSRATSPLPPRPPSSLSLRSKSAASAAGPSTAGPSTNPSGPKLLRKPKRVRTYGDGTELDAFDDLPTDRDKESQFRVQPSGYGNRVPGAMYPPKTSESKDSGKGTLRRKTARTLSSSGSGPETAPRTLKRTGRIESTSKPSAPDPSPKRKKVASPVSHTRRKPTLIRNLGGSGAPKVVGEMKWNPHKLRWEGNDQALRDFDTALAPTRPALITHLTGSSVGSPVGSFASGARRVGNMIFDPGRMCWISALAPEDDEPDVFADLADDEEDGDGWEAQGGTIRAGQPQPAPGAPPVPSETSRSSASSRIESPSPARSRTRSPSESGSDRGSRASVVYDVDDSFLEKCRQAEERHWNELKGWRGKLEDVAANSDRSYLFEIRALATRKY